MYRCCKHCGTKPGRSRRPASSGWAWPLRFAVGPGPGDWAQRPYTGVIERTHAWGNQYGKLRWCTERRRTVVEFWLALANATIVCGRLIRRAWIHYRWDARPRRRP